MMNEEPVKSGAADYRGENLAGTSFADARFDGAAFNGADLRGSDFSRASLIGTDFTDAGLGLRRPTAAVLFGVSLLIVGHRASYLPRAT